MGRRIGEDMFVEYDGHSIIVERFDQYEQTLDRVVQGYGQTLDRIVLGPREWEELERFVKGLPTRLFGGDE